MKKILLSIALMLAGMSFLFAQIPAQTIRGEIRDAYTQKPLPGVGIRLLTVDPPIDVVSGEKGKFRIEDVPVGRHDIAFAHPDFESFTMPAVLVSSAREVVLEVEMQVRTFEMEEVTLVPPREKGRPQNEMATISAISFEAEETRKFAGGLDDPTRLVATMPGVMDNSFISDNLISIRANSPRGLLYRLEGIELPNPNHFARIGSAGGTFTIFSNQLLANSDFFTGAFPAEFGNATAGVFDIRFRNGNNERRQYALQASVLGVDLAAEGPFKKGGKASYLVNYRFSTLTAANLLINYLSLPEFQDISFKLNFPTKAGTFGVFGIGGLSTRLREAELDPSLWVEDLDRFELELGSDMGALGATHKLLIGEKTVWKSALVGSYSDLIDNKTYLEEDLVFRLRDRNQYKRQPFSFSTSLKHIFGDHHVNKTGVMLTTTQHEQFTEHYDYVNGVLNTLVDERGRTYRLQAYSQSSFRLTDKFTANIGAHFLHFNLNNQSSIEPRLGLKYQLSNHQSLAFGYGLHSQVEHFGTYVMRPDSLSQPNLELDFVKSHHWVLGYYLRFLRNHKLRIEAYYQRLLNVPVEAGGSFSALNLSELDEIRALVSDGTGYNMGIDASLERFTENGLYYLFNISVFDAKYTGGDGIERNSAFNNHFKANLLMGKELAVGNTKSNLLGFNGALAITGGRRYTPIDLDASRLARETVFDESLAWSQSEQTLVVLDFTFTYRKNRPNASHIWAVQVKNMLQNALPEYREYDALLDREVTLVGASILPIISYKVEF